MTECENFNTRIDYVSIGWVSEQILGTISRDPLTVHISIS